MSLRARMRRRRQVSFLLANGADAVEHSGDRLLDHLLATHDLLASWGARPALCEAALFHSVYGTQFLGEELLGSDRRGEVRALIGAEAEELAWLWHAVRRESLAANLGRTGDWGIETRDGEALLITRDQFEDLVNLMFADAVEQLPRRGEDGVRNQGPRLRPLMPVAMPAASAAARELLG